MSSGRFSGGQGKADGEGVAAEAREEIGAAFDGVEQLKSVDGAAGAVGDAIAVFHADDDGRLGGALDHARGENADDAAMPAVAVDDQQAVGGEFAHRVARRASMAVSAAASTSRRSRFSRSSLAASSAARCESRVEKSSITSEATSMRPAALMRGARRKATSKPVSCLAGGIERGGGKERAQAGAHGAAQLAQAQRGDDAIFAAQRNGVGDGGDGRHLQKTGQSLFAGARRVAALQQGLRQLERNGRAAERFFRVGAAGLVGIQNGQRGGNSIAGVRQDGGR